MSNENEDGQKRKRPTLYKKDDKAEQDADVLKKLKEVRQNLQDSLDQPAEKEGPATTHKRGERRLYKKEEEKPIEKAVITKKPQKQISSKRMALVQKRVKEKIKATEGISKKKKAIIMVWIVIMSIPLFFLTSLSILGLEFNFNEFGLVYNENKPGTIIFTFPARNPSFLPATVGQFEIELYSADGDYIGTIYNNEQLSIAPYQTETMFLTLALEKEEGGKWIKEWLSTMIITLKIGKMTYNGLVFETDFIPVIEVDTGPILRDMISGLLDIEELLNGLSLEEMLTGEAEATTAPSSSKFGTSGGKISLDPYTNAKKKSLLPRLSQIGGMEDMTANISFGMSENEEEFNLGLSATIDLLGLVTYEDLGGIVLGPIRMSNLDVQLMVSTDKKYKDSAEIKDDDGWAEHYEKTIAKIFTTKENEIYIADPKERNTKIGMNVTIFKDDPAKLRGSGNAKYHPSQDIDWSAGKDDLTNPKSLGNFLEGTGNFSNIGGPAWQSLPGWYFLYNLLGEGGLDCAINIKNVDIEIFGLDIEGLSIPMEILPPLYLDAGVLDPNNFLNVAPDYGLVGILKHFEKAITETPARAFMGIPLASEGESGIPPEKELDAFLTDFTSMIEFPDLDFNAIQETWGPDATLHVELPITLNNSMLNFYVGFSGMQVSIASEINNVKKNFLELSVTGNESNMVYIAGINSITTLNISLNIFKNSSCAPYATKFLSQLIENFTLDAVISAKFDKLVLFKQNYTYGAFDIALPIVMDIESFFSDLVGSMVPSVLGGLLTTGDENATAGSTGPMSPLKLLMSMSPVSGMVSLLGKVDDLQVLAAQTEEGGAEPDAISEMINGLINDLVPGLFGGLLGDDIDLKFELGLEVEVSEARYTKFTIKLDNFFVSDFFITIGMGETKLNIQSKNQYGEWENLIGLEIDDYFEIKEAVEEDIEVSIIVYETNAMCHFIDTFMSEFFNASTTPKVDLRVAGYTTVNVSGIFLPDLDMEITFEELDLGLNGTEMIGDVFDMIYDIDLGGADNSKPQMLNVWAGPVDKLPVLSALDIESLFHLGEISIEEISETKFSNDTEGVGLVKLSIQVTNYMMTVDIKKFSATIFKENPVDVPSQEPLIELSVDDGQGLDYRSNRQINITLTIYKSHETESMMNHLINTLSLSGWLNFSMTIKVFGCTIDIKPTYLPAINLTRLPIDLTELLGSFMPFTAPFMNLMGPRVSQEINMDSIFENVLKFSIGKVNVGKYHEVGPLDYENPVLDVGADLWIQTMFNMSIRGLKLQLLDGDLYKALYVNGGHNFLDVAREASIAEIVMRNPTYFNSCVPLFLGPNGYPVNDPKKPYVYNTSTCEWVNETTEPWDCDVKFELSNISLAAAGRTVGLNSTQFNETAENGGGFTNDNYLYLSIPTLNNLSVYVELYNKSHGTWDTRYDRKYWRALGGPYFPPQYFGKEYGGYPDHYYVYNKYYAPLVSIVNKAIKLLDENGIANDTDAVKALIGGIAIAGEVNITMFSMDLDINLNNPKLNAMFEPVSALFLGTTGLALKEYIAQISNPMRAYQDPSAKLMERMMMSQGIEDLMGDMLDMSSIPLDINQVIGGLSFPGIADRTDHAYSPNNQNQDGASRCWDGHANWDNQLEYNLNPDRVSNLKGYEGGLDDPYFTGEWDTQAQAQYPSRTEAWHPKETFFKDDGYEWFKTHVDNWAQSRGIENPYFETRKTESDSFTQSYNSGEEISDPTLWPLKYDYGAYGGRCATSVLTFHLGMMLKLPVGLLAGKLALYLEDPYEACQYVPFGYIWINSSVNLMTLDDIMSTVNDAEMAGYLADNPQGITWAEIEASYSMRGLFADPADPDYQAKVDTATLALCQAGTMPPYTIDSCGNPTSPGWVAVFNIRVFEGMMSHQFFWQLLANEFNFMLITQGLMNVSLFGYEIYNIFLPSDIATMGNPTEYAARCDAYKSQSGGGYGNIGIPSFGSGELTGNNIEKDKEEKWPHYILIGKSLEFAISIPLDSILDFESFLDFGSLLNNLDGGIFGQLGGLGQGQGILVNLHLPIKNPVPLILWITTLYLEVWLGSGPAEGTPNVGWDDVNWWSTRILVYTRVNTALILWDTVAPGRNHYGDTEDPWDFNYNIYNNWHTPHQLSVAIQANIPIDLTLLQLLIMGAWGGVKTLEIEVLLPSGLDYEIPLVFDLGDMSSPFFVSVF